MLTSAHIPATYTIAVTLIDPCSPILSYLLLLLFRGKFQRFMSLNVKSLLVSLIVREKQKQLLAFVLFFCVFVSIFVVVGRAFEDTVVSCKGCYYGAATATGSAAPKPRPALKSTLVKRPSCQ